MHTLTVNGEPCVVVVYPDGRVELNAQSVSCVDSVSKPIKQPKTVPAKKTPKKAKSLLASLVGGSGKPQNINWIDRLSNGPNFGNGPRF